MQKFLLLFLSAISILSQKGFAQESKSELKKNRGKLYVSWGYNREAYTRSTIHFRNNGSSALKDQYGQYDFKIYKAKAEDRSDFHALGDIKNFTIPQFSCRVGYYFNNEKDEGFELNYDHAKYVVSEGQTVRMKGSAFGVAFDKDTVLDSHFIHFEHTDGANFMMFNYLKRWKFWNAKNEKSNFGLVIKPGIGFVLPRTDVTLFGNRLNNDWHIAGVVAGVETGARVEFFNYFCAELTGKIGYANYISCLVQGKGNGKASHQFGFAEGIFTLGFCYPL